MTNVLKSIWEQMHKDGYNAFSGTMLFNSIFRNFLHILDQKDVLDIGCGSGDAFQWMKDVCKEYRGIDISPRASANTNKRFGHIEKFKGAVTCDGTGEIPFPDKVFDVVFSALVFQHVHQQFLEKYFFQAHRVLHLEGELLFHTTEWAHQYQGKNDVSDPFEKDYALSGQYSHNFDVVVPMLEKAGFKLLKFEKTQNEPGLKKENAHWLVFHAKAK